MRLLVTGAAGLVGGAITNLAARRGHELLLVWHTAQPPLMAEAHALRCDLQDPVAVDLLPTDVDAVIHAAARIPVGNCSDRAAATANRIADDQLLQHYAKSGFAGKWVYISSASIEDPALRRTSKYAKEKAETEHRTALAFPERTRSLRISSPYGHGMRHMNVLRRFAEAAQSGEAITLLGTGGRTQDFVHVDDVASAALAAIEAEGGDPVVIASGQPVSMAELARLVVQVTRSSSPIEITGRPDPQELFRANYDIQAAYDAIGWVPTIRLDAGLRSMLRAT